MCEINPKHSAFFNLEVFTSDGSISASEFMDQVLRRLLEAEMNLNADGKFRFHIHSKDEAPDRSGIAADDDPTRRPIVSELVRRIADPMGEKTPKCEGCDEPDWNLRPQDVISTTDKTRATLNLCEYCTEIAANADPITGSYGAAAAEWVLASRVEGIQK